MTELCDGITSLHGIHALIVLIVLVIGQSNVRNRTLWNRIIVWYTFVDKNKNFMILRCPVMCNFCSINLFSGVYTLTSLFAMPQWFLFFTLSPYKMAIKRKIRKKKAEKENPWGCILYPRLIEYKKCIQFKSHLASIKKEWVTGMYVNQYKKCTQLW